MSSIVTGGYNLMKKISIEYKVFNFEELKDSVKDEVIQKYYENEDYPFLEDELNSDVDYFDKHCIFEGVKLQYSLGYSQGDGLSFSCNINILNFLNNIYSKKLPKYKKNAINKYIYQVYSKGNDRRYCYASKGDIDFVGESYNYNKNLPKIERLWHNILEEIEQYYLKICSELEKSGYATLDYRMNYDEFQEHCNSNGYNFLENGEMVNY